MEAAHSLGRETVIPALDRALEIGDERILEDTRDRRGTRLDRAERRALGGVGGAFAGVAATLAVLAHPTGADVALALTLTAAYALVSRVEFEILTGSAVPTELLLLPMLVLLPPGIVPAAVATGLLCGGVVDAAAQRVHAERALLGLVSSWHAVGPTLVVWVLHPSAGSWRDAWVYAVALGAQFAFDVVAVGLWERLTGGASFGDILRYVPRSWAVDTTLAPVGLAFAIAAQPSPYLVLLVLPLAGLLALFAKERAARIDGILDLSQAYRGTAFLLGDVVEADDAYTGLHSRDVVQLSVAVAERLGLPEATVRDTELTALLHDVGKIRIPAEIINKPGALTPEERAVIETHTILGQEMLEPVGGLLARVGAIVRSCHERWDGNGYPDRLEGETIPLVARIVACCDAFSAMTTDRSYRKALSEDEAIAETRDVAGAQFDPQVVEALHDVVRSGRLARATPPGR